MGEKRTWSDRLAIALACLAAVMALVLLWMEKTPLWAGATIICMAALIVYPVIHFAHSMTPRIILVLLAWAFIGLFGWHIWPKHPEVVTSAPTAAPSTAAGKPGNSPDPRPPARPPTGTRPKPKPQIGNLKGRAMLLSQDILTFLTDRQSNAPPLPRGETWKQDTDAEVRYIEETKVLFSQRFGPRVIAVRAELAEKGFRDSELDTYYEDPTTTRDFRIIGERIGALAQQIRQPQ